MQCENSLSFKLYFSRVIKRLKGWIAFIIQLVIALGEVCIKLSISPRTLRRYLQRLKEEGVYTLTRKKRSDAGILRVFSEEILKKAL